MKHKWSINLDFFAKMATGSRDLAKLKKNLDLGYIHPQTLCISSELMFQGFRLYLGKVTKVAELPKY